MKFSHKGLCFAALVATALACGTSGSERVEPAPVVDAGAAAAPVDAAAAHVARLLVRAGQTVPVGVTPGGMVVYATVEKGRNTVDLEAVPLTGGAPVTIATGIELVRKSILPILFSNGAVAWWTKLDEVGIGTLGVWNEIDGAKMAVSTASFVAGRVDGRDVGVFAASEDGRRIAFSTNANASVADLGVIDVANAGTAAAGLLPSADRFATVGTCVVEMRFFGARLVATFCTESGETRAYVVPEGKATAVRFDDKGDATGPFTAEGWSADLTGHKVLLLGEDGGRFVDLTDVGAIASVAVSAEDGFITRSGNAVIRRSAGDVRRSFAPTRGGDGKLTFPDDGEILLATGIQTHAGLSNLTKDESRVFILEREPGYAVRTIDANAPSNARMMLPIGGIVGVTTGNRVVLASGTFVGTSVAGLTIKAKRAAGGTARELATGVTFVAVSPETETAVVLVSTTPNPDGFIATTSELRRIDVATATPDVVSDGVVSPVVFAGSKIVYSRSKEPGAGLYVYDPK